MALYFNISNLTIFIEALKKYTFTILNVELTYAIFLLPLLYFIVNYITKKYGYKTSVVSITLSGLGLVLFYTLISFALGSSLQLQNISGEFCGYVISQFVNLTIYSVLTESLFGKEIDVLVHLGLIGSYIISSFINLIVYYFLFMNTNIPKVTLFTNYLFSLIINYMFYTLIYLNKVALNNFWKGYLITLIIQAVICLFISFIDLKVKRGIEKDA